MLFQLFFTFISILIGTQVCFELNVLPSNVHLYSHEICFSDYFVSFIPIMVLRTFKFTSSGMPGTYSLSDKSSKLLKLPPYTSKLIANR